MRTLLASVTFLALAGFATAADVDAKKLLGKWEPAKPEKDGPTMVLEIMDKGKFVFHVTFNGKTQKVDGTYKIDGEKIEVEMKIGDKTEKDTLTVIKLTDTEMVTKGKSGKEETMKKVK
ncbi:MAG: TIGR03066 family protein [Planctomycetes bacterium]|nr:TIGR03066 family protein [Planctomycetota bacterium]